MSSIVAFFAALAWSAPAVSVAADATIKVDLSDLAAQAKEVVNIHLNKATVNWASQAVGSNANAAELRELMKDLDSIHIQVLEFDEQSAPPRARMAAIEKEVLKRLEGPGWTNVVAVTERKKDGDEIVRVSLFSDDAGAPGGLAVFVLERNEIVLVNIAGRVRLDQLGRLGNALGQPGLFGSMGIQPAQKK
ncbi:MAG: DUF4252 domain-containing protein, partial [Vicinamibacteria bacterium]|nr:DUF4252 domain-containing protein [Vicinamibacteria bacterium]